ncbi:energy transducer TonB [Bradyrhizobium sp.]|uniref:energy transducer TonB n=1 Tax=Bradyrhizobium sp. TaxID=376 RepID=UPI003C226CAB
MTKGARYLVFLSLSVGVWTGQMSIPETAGCRALAQSDAPSQPPPGPPTKGWDGPDPESGSVVGTAYENKYFGLSVPLPQGWSKGLAGPPPSAVGSYVLSAFDGTKAERASILIVAQDLFFGAKPFASAAEMAADFSDAIRGISYMTIDRGLDSIAIRGHDFLRLDYNAGGLYRVWLATELRCHSVMFNITGTDRTQVENIARGLEAMALPGEAGTQLPAGAGAEQTIPVCIKDYATEQTLLRKVDPVPNDPRGVDVPVRIIIGQDGRVRHVHVISASPAQRQAIVEALTQWEFKPYVVTGRPAEVETGVLFKFKPHGT